MKKLIQRILFLLGLFTAIIGCQREDEDTILTSENKIEALSGEEVFRSIIFADGALASEIPALANNFDYRSFFTNDEFRQFRETQFEIIDKIKEDSPNYFKEFKANMLSNDYQKIRNSINNASLTINRTVEKLYPIHENISLIDNLFIENSELEDLSINAEGRRILDLQTENLPINVNEFQSGFAVIIIIAIGIVLAGVVGFALTVDSVKSSTKALTEISTLTDEEEEENTRSRRNSKNNLLLNDITASIINLNQ